MINAQRLCFHCQRRLSSAVLRVFFNFSRSSLIQFGREQKSYPLLTAGNRNLNCTALATVAPGIDKLTISIDVDDLAVIGAASTADFACNKFHVFNVEIKAIAISSAAGQDSCTHDAHQMPVFVYGHTAVQHILKGFYNTDIFAYAALKHHWGGDLFPFSHIV